MIYANNQKGSSFFIVVLAVTLIGIIAVVGFRIMHKDTAASKIDISKVNNQIPAKISSTTDIKKADIALDGEQIDKTLNSSQLDADLKALN